MHLSMFLAPRVFDPAEEMAVIDADIEQALEADERGFSAIYVGEQHHNGYEPYSDPFTIGGYLAGQLKDAYIGTSVVSLVLHHPLMLIERINALDLLTRGRVMIGMSSGQPMNGTAFGIGELGSAGRAQLFDQRVDLLLRAWAHRPEDGPLAFETDAETGVMDGRVMPYSYRVPHPLFAVATSTADKVIAAGRRGFHVHLGPTPLEQAVELAGLYRDALAAAGHDDDAIAARMRWFISTKWIVVGETDEEAWQIADRTFGAALHFLPWLTKDERYEGRSLRELHEMDPGPFAAAFGMPESPAAWTQRCHIVGSPETVAEELRAWEAAGIAHVHARWIMTGVALDAGRRSWRLFADEVMPRLEIERIAGPQDAEIREAYRGSRAGG